MRVHPFKMSERINSLIPNNVTMTNGTTLEFYTVEHGEAVIFDEVSGSIVAYDEYMIGNSYNLYEQYINYVPDISSRINLNSASQHQTNCIPEEGIPPRSLESSEEDLMSTEYFIFYFMAQVGGLYSFLVLILGFIVGHVASKSFEYDLVNLFNDYNSENEQSMDSLRNDRKVMPDILNEDQNRSENNRNDPLSLGQINAGAEGPKQISKKIPHRNQNGNELSDGEEQLHNTSRSSSYSTGDLIYRIFC